LYRFKYQPVLQPQNGRHLKICLAGGVAQAIEHLSIMHKTLYSNSSTTQRACWEGQEADSITEACVEAYPTLTTSPRDPAALCPFFPVTPPNTYTYHIYVQSYNQCDCGRCLSAAFFPKPFYLSVLLYFGISSTQLVDVFRPHLA
jgi:hypothetical protein